MSDFLKEEDVAGTCFRVGDCHIWAEIYYLDSPTDYREYLPGRNPRARAAEGELVMLESARSGSKIFAAIVACTAIVLLLFGYLICLFAHSL